MESKFPQRVMLERRAIDLVNGSFNGVISLPGLSSKAVSRWIRGLADRFEVESLVKLEVTLRFVAEAARSEADVSDEIFLDIDDLQAAEAMEALEKAISTVKSKIGSV